MKRALITGITGQDDPLISNRNSVIDITCRLITSDDSNDVLTWRNDVVSRKMSLNPGVVSQVEHSLWFLDMLNDNSHVGLIGMLNGEKIGVAFVKMNDDVGKVSININPLHRGNRLGSILLRNSLLEFQKSSPKLLEYSAEIKDINKASIKIFTQNGFKFHCKKYASSTYILKSNTVGVGQMFEIDGYQISTETAPYIVGEISANHNGKIENAFKIIDMIKRAGANAVKMQTYTPDTITLKSKKSDFQIQEGLWAGTSLYELYEKAFTPWDWHKDIFEYAKAQNISIFSTPFDYSAIELLENLDAPAYKIASFECIDLPLIKTAASTGKPLIISTGMADQREIQDAVDTALKYGNGALTLLHCISAYPAPADDYNLQTIKDMKSRFGVDIGLSDHTLDNTTAIAAVALGAVMVEKHVTLDRNGGGPDDSFSLEEDGLRELCMSTKAAWKSLGKANYERTEAEKGNVKFRRSLYYVRELQNGDTITEGDIRSVRPGFGLPPKYYDQLIGSKVKKSVEENSPVTLQSVDLKLD